MGDKREARCPYCGGPLSKFVKYDNFIFSKCPYCGKGVIIGKDTVIKNIDYVTVPKVKEKIIVEKDKGWRIRYAISIGVFVGIIFSTIALFYYLINVAENNFILKGILQIVPILVVLSIIDRIFSVGEK